MTVFATASSSWCGHRAVPKLRLPTDGVRVAVVAVATSTRPAPCSNTDRSELGAAVDMSVAFNRSAPQSGC